MNFLKNHLRNNQGDANVSKMTMIAIAFVVGAILLVLTTSAFRSPINHWFNKVTNGWFADDNGMFEADNQFLGVERNANGTYKVEYSYTKSDGSQVVLYDFDTLEGKSGYTVDGQLDLDFRNANGIVIGGGEYMGCSYVISDDGKSITLDGVETFYAQPPQ